MSDQVTIHNNTMPLVEFRGQRVVTFAMIDQAHGRPKGTAKEAFRRNRHRFIEGVDTYLVDYSKKNVLHPFGIKVPTRGVRVMTEAAICCWLNRLRMTSLRWRCPFF